MASQKKSGTGRIWLIIIGLFLVVILIAVYRAFQPSVKVPQRSVLLLNINGDLPEAILNEPPPFFADTPPVSMREITTALQHAKTDERIKMAVVKIELLDAPLAKISELREAIKDFRASGKKIVAYLGFTNNKEYYLASACDRIYAEPQAFIVLNGLKSERFYYRTTLEKVGIEFESSGRGKYKSAPEIYLRDSSSAPSREQTNALLDDFDAAFIKETAAGRGITETNLRRLINTEALIHEDLALKEKIIDSAVYFSDFKKKLRNDFGAGEKEEFFIRSNIYAASAKNSGDEKIAIVYVEGGIVSGDGGVSPDGGQDSGGETISKAIEDAAKDESIKAIILRIDSPGGDGLAMNQMAKAVKEAKAKKPVVVSMAGVAASAGYGIAMNATKIIAHPLTVTGSIGVFSLKPNMEKLIEKIGLHREVIARGKFADALTLYRKFTPEETAKFDESTARFYNRFITDVAAGRRMKVGDVDSIAQGRVWSGQRAVKIGLVDALGGFKVAVATAKNLAKIDSSKSIELVSYPEGKSFYESLFGSRAEGGSPFEQFKQSLRADAERDAVQSLMGGSWAGKELRRIKQAMHVLASSMTLRPQAVMPCEINIK